MATFDEERLVALLDGIVPVGRVAFAAACVTRLQAARQPAPVPQLAPETLERLWKHLLSGESLGFVVETRLGELGSLLEPEGVHPIAEDTIAGLMYALRALGSGEAQEAAWTARRTYEALDWYVINRWDIDLNDPTAERRIRETPLIQEELDQQERDIAALMTGDESALPEVMREMELRAVAVGRTWLLE